MLDWLGEQIWGAMLMWFYETIFHAASEFFTMMGNMGADIFDLPWVNAMITLFTYLGWALYVSGTIVAVFDFAIEYQSGRGNLNGSALSILKGFFAASLIGTVPVELYQFAVSLQNTFAGELAVLFSGTQSIDLPSQSAGIFQNIFLLNNLAEATLFGILLMAAFIYCVVKVFFQNIKRGGMLLIQVAVGSLYLFSVPRGFTDGFVQWMKQVIAICLTAFMQTTILYLGLMTFTQYRLLGLGIMLAANEVPRIAGQFGLDSSARVNVMSAVHATSTAVHMSRTLLH